jgi:class 3 adenylate cyclase
MAKLTPDEIARRFKQQVEHEVKGRESIHESPQGVSSAVEMTNEIEVGAIVVGLLHPIEYSQDEWSLNEMARDVDSFLRLVVANVTNHDGVVSRYFGPMIMCQFGGLLANPNAPHALNAFRALSDISSELASQNAQRAATSQRQLNTGFGVVYGKVLGGVRGYERYTSYELIGGHVYLAIALAQLARDGQCFANDQFVLQIDWQGDPFPTQQVLLTNGNIQTIYRVMG